MGGLGFLRSAFFFRAGRAARTERPRGAERGAGTKCGDGQEKLVPKRNQFLNPPSKTAALTKKLPSRAQKLAAVPEAGAHGRPVKGNP